jgi:putative FmdB family regulatory protein
MPMYEYQCCECEGIVERFFKMSEKPQEFTDKCPLCGLIATHKSIMSAVAMSYNGFNHAAKVPSDLKNRFDQIRKHYPNMQSTI